MSRAMHTISAECQGKRWDLPPALASCFSACAHVAPLPRAAFTLTSLLIWYSGLKYDFTSCARKQDLSRSSPCTYPQGEQSRVQALAPGETPASLLLERVCSCRALYPSPRHARAGTVTGLPLVPCHGVPLLPGVASIFQPVLLRFH